MLRHPQRTKREVTQDGHREQHKAGIAIIALLLFHVLCLLLSAWTCGLRWRRLRWRHELIVVLGNI